MLIVWNGDMIVAEKLTKDYGEEGAAVDDLRFSVQPGAVTGFLGPNGSGKSTTMRMILGLDGPTAGRVTGGGKPLRDHPAPLYEVEALLEARSVHPGRTAYNHLLSLAQTNGIPRSRVDEVIDLVGLHDVARKRAGQFSLGMDQRLGIASALLGDPDTVFSTSRSTVSIQRASTGSATCSRVSLPKDARSSCSSHLMSEMALTADHLVVIGRGRLIVETSVDAFIEMGIREACSRAES